MPSVYIFNAAPAGVYMTVNNGPNRFVVTECDKTTWAPGSPPAADLPNFTGAATAPAGEFKVGVNSVDLAPVLGGSAQPTTITIPNSVNPRSTLQLYLFWETTASVSWMLLADGQPIGGNLVLA